MDQVIQKDKQKKKKTNVERDDENMGSPATQSGQSDRVGFIYM